MAQRKPRQPLNEEGLWAYALRTLGRSAQSAGELREKMRRRAERAGDVDTVIARLREYGYLDDSRFAGGFATARVENQGFGKARVLRDLRQRRVAPKVAEKAVDAAFSEIDEVQLIHAFLERKYRRVNLPELLADRNRLASIYRRLRHAGFSPGNTVRVLTEYAREAEMLEDAGEEEETE